MSATTSSIQLNMPLAKICSPPAAIFPNFLKWHKNYQNIRVIKRNKSVRSFLEQPDRDSNVFFQVKTHYLPDYLLKMKQDGYTIVGAEQTSKSQPLHEVQLPRRTVLLLGSEKEGTPPHLLPFLDLCVEVPQLGVIRSLNVHVTGALFVWEYAKQHAFAQNLN